MVRRFSFYNHAAIIIHQHQPVKTFLPPTISSTKSTPHSKYATPARAMG
jgi:hypothetical protein